MLIQLIVSLLGGDVQFMLGLGLGRLEGAGEDAHLGVLDLLGHLRMGELLVDDDAMDQLGLLQAAAGLALHLDHVEVHVLVVQIGHAEHGVHGDLSHLALVDVDDLRAQSGHGRVHQGSGVFLGKLHCIC